MCRLKQNVTTVMINRKLMQNNALFSVPKMPSTDRINPPNIGVIVRVIKLERVSTALSILQQSNRWTI